jgi:hypothetical protein
MTSANSWQRSLLTRSLTALAIAACVSSLAPAGETKPQPSWKVPRTLDGQPDLQGNWTNATLTPFERPQKYAERRSLTAAEATEIENSEAELARRDAAPTDPNKGIQDLPTDCGRGFTGVNCGYNAFWVDPGTTVMTIDGERRSSILIDPPNGRLPAQTPEARQRAGARATALRMGSADGPESRSLGERCLMSFGSSAGPPMLPLLYNNHYQIVQNRDTVVILVEMVHDARIIHLDPKHQRSTVRRWMGDSMGRWEGDTLVVETINFHPLQQFRGASANLKVTERFTRVSPTQILYGFTVEDPSTFVQPFSGELSMSATQEKMYEYACHEGNYALPGILAGAREAERAAQPK